MGQVLFYLIFGFIGIIGIFKIRKKTPGRTAAFPKISISKKGSDFDWGAQAIGACLQLMIRTLTATSQRLICDSEHLCRGESMAEMIDIASGNLLHSYGKIHHAING
jgi:hypothetical protein